MAYAELKHRVSLLSLFSVVLLASMCVAGCGAREDDQKAARNIAVWGLEKAAKSENPIERQRAEEALLKLRNGVPDTEPILVQATLFYPESGGRILGIVCYDEDEDLLGWRIREESHDRNGAVTTMEERYPVYAGHPKTDPYFAFAYEVRIRSTGQQKDEQAWQMWVQNELARLGAETGARAHEADTAASSAEASGTEMPPVWISVPKPDKRVFFAIYDRAGHESEEFEIKIPSWRARALEEWGRSQPPN